MTGHPSDMLKCVVLPFSQRDSAKNVCYRLANPHVAIGGKVVNVCVTLASALLT